ncbi:MAG: GspE/PulE family protein [Alicyclobacillus sp.]|nr:GspE/PulE family protein [Alicyclobacillus sp.]
MARKRLGDLLVDMGLLSADQLAEALREQQQSKERLGELIVRKGWVSEAQIIEALEFQLGIPHVDLNRQSIDRQALQLIPEAVARRHLALPLRRDRQKLQVAMADPLDFYALEDLRAAAGCQVEPVLAAKEQLRTWLDRCYGLTGNLTGAWGAGTATTAGAAERASDVDLSRELTDEDAPAVRVVNQLLRHGVALRASDIHLDPEAQGLRVRYRIDGVLRTEQVLPKALQAAVVARIKILANLNIAERRLPQDGRMRVEYEQRPVDVRVSTLPTVHGEKCVLRLLDARHGVRDVASLHFSPDNEMRFRSLFRAPFGMVLITGPTGSGKTSTLYAALRELASEERNIVTIEDPVEYQLPGVNQVQVNLAAGLTFARGLRAILRQDPDVVMVGEIRDQETAEIAIRAALTGHLVLSTLHTNDTAGAVTRLVDMGIEPFLVASAVLGVVAQRLVRRVCPQCAETYSLPPAEQAFLQHALSSQAAPDRSEASFSAQPSGRKHRLLDQDLDGHVLEAERPTPRADGVTRTPGNDEGTWRPQRGRGCPACNRTGYAGRLAVQEVLRMDEPLRAAVVARQPEAVLRQLAVAGGMRRMLDDALDKVQAGWTTVAEVMRVALPE